MLSIKFSSLEVVLYDLVFEICTRENRTSKTHLVCRERRAIISTTHYQNSSLQCGVSIMPETWMIKKRLVPTNRCSCRLLFLDVSVLQALVLLSMARRQSTSCLRNHPTNAQCHTHFQHNNLKRILNGTR
jgi:hypothetical protein